jgi:putative hemolysin
MQWLTKVSFPLVRLMSFVTELVMRLLNVRASEEPPVTKEEINVLMEQGADAGVFEKHEQALVSRVFGLADEIIANVMTPRGDIAYVDLNDSFETNRQKLLHGSHSRFLVCNGGLGQVLGIQRAKSLLDAALEGKPFDFASGAVKPLYVPSSLSLIELLEAFKKHRQHLALVVDEFGEVQGLVTMNNVMEALVGEVATVEDESQPDIVQRQDGSWLVDGSVPIARFKEVAHIEAVLPGEDAEAYRTLGGFMMMALARVPQVGDRFTAEGVTIEVVDMDQNRVDKLLVTRAPSGDQSAA